MGLNHSPNVVRNGLVLYLDAANVKSYSGSGTTWTDLSGNGNDFLLFNSPTFSNNYFSLNGTNQYIRSSSTLDLSSFSSLTIEIAFAANISNSQVGITFEHSADWNSYAGGFGMFPNSNGGNTYLPTTQHTNHKNSSGAVNYVGSVTTQTQIHTNIFSKVSDATGRNSYVNGVETTFVLGSKVTNNATAFRNDYMHIGSRGGTSLFANQKIHYMMVYGRKLSAAEVSQNFNALRGRYGL